jgi:flagellar basal-body rod modification protein FlgD
MLNQNQFLQLLTAQLKNQDPLNPVSGTDFNTQLAQFSSLSALQQLNANFQQLLQLQQLSQGAALVGKTVLYLPAGATSPTRGVVDSVNFQNGQLVLSVGGKSVPVSQITGLVAS